MKRASLKCVCVCVLVVSLLPYKQGKKGVSVNFSSLMRATKANIQVEGLWEGARLLLIFVLDGKRRRGGR